MADQKQPEQQRRPVTTTLEEAAETGYLGTPVDQTPREEYTVAGVLKRQSMAPPSIVSREDVGLPPKADDKTKG